MKTPFAVTTRARLASLVLAVLASATVLGTTAQSMRPRHESAAAPVVAFERVVVGPAAN